MFLFVIITKFFLSGVFCFGESGDGYSQMLSNGFSGAKSLDIEKQRDDGFFDEGDDRLSLALEEVSFLMNGLDKRQKYVVAKVAFQIARNFAAEETERMKGELLRVFENQRGVYFNEKDVSQFIEQVDEKTKESKSIGRRNNSLSMGLSEVMKKDGNIRNEDDYLASRKNGGSGSYSSSKTNGNSDWRAPLSQEEGMLDSNDDQFVQKDSIAKRLLQRNTARKSQPRL
eukprot:GHVN01088346.1.p1 GENE.GHVN01088346.1~~GHVN01088346.1.p1  ORF type:complete len:228 (+),score=29.08 GHVN01088346.1:242-925(+)